jgi:hypothetical protein
MSPYKVIKKARVLVAHTTWGENWIATGLGLNIFGMSVSEHGAKIYEGDCYSLRTLQYDSYVPGWRERAFERFKSGLVQRGLIIFALVLLLGGCGTAPVRVERMPDVCPALPATPAQAKKVLAPALPTLDEAEMASGDKHRIASEILRVRVDSAAQYQACRANNDALETWALSHSQE